MVCTYVADAVEQSGLIVPCRHGGKARRLEVELVVGDIVGKRLSVRASIVGGLKPKGMAVKVKKVAQIRRQRGLMVLLQ